MDSCQEVIVIMPWVKALAEEVRKRQKHRKQQHLSAENELNGGEFMIYNATREIEKEFQAADLNYTVEETEKLSFLQAGLVSKQGIPAPMRFLSADDDNDVAIRVCPVARVPEDKKPQMLELINDFHNRFRYIRFYLDSDNDLTASYDLPVKAESIGESAVEIFARFSQILDTVYPEIMRTIWS